MVCRNRRAGLTPYGGGVDVLRRGDAILAVAYCRQRLLCPAQIQRGSELVGHRDLYDLVFSDAVRKSAVVRHGPAQKRGRSEEHTSELQSLMRISYAVFCLKKKNNMETITDRY